jgi:cytoskeleton protein RodZ
MSPTSTFGEHLKREREMRGVSLEEISAATRISVRFLEALENEHWAQLPGGIFNRGFIRSVARFLGMDEEGLVAEYALETRERPEIAVWTKEPVRKRRNWFAIIVTIIVLAAIIAGGWYASQRYGPSITAWHARHPIFRTVMAKLRHKNGTSATDAPVNAAPVAPPTANQVQQAAVPLSNGNAPVPSNGSADNSAAKAASSPISTPANAAPQNTSEASNGMAKSSAIAAGPMELKVEAGETSTVTVAADGKNVFSGKLDALKSLTFHAQKSFTVSASKSNAVLLELNGRTVPPLGPPNQPGKITLTRDNLKSISGDGY